jgi:GNAT superfamily N-acetyltransferase
VNLRDATAADAAALDSMIRELAAYEGHTGELAFTVDQLARALSGSPPRLRAAIAEDADGAAGFVTYTIDYAIWTGGDVLRVDDVFVRERARGGGTGRRLMLRIAELALAGGLSSRWEIEPGNRGAQRFYESLGVEIRDKKVARWSPAASDRAGCGSDGASEAHNHTQREHFWPARDAFASRGREML